MPFLTKILEKSFEKTILFTGGSCAGCEPEDFWRTEKLIMSHRSGHVVKTLFFHYDIEDFYVNDALGMVAARSVLERRWLSLRLLSLSKRRSR